MKKKDMKRVTFHPEDIEMLNEHIEICSTSVAIRKMQLQITISLYTYPPKWQK